RPTRPHLLKPTQYRHWPAIVLAVLVFAVAAALAYRVRNSTRKIAPGTWVLLTNVVDGTGAKADHKQEFADVTELLRGQLEQSPHFHLASATEVRDALQSMKQQEVLKSMATNRHFEWTEDLARDVAKHLSAARVIFGSVSRFGSTYTLSIQVQRPD